MKPTQELPRTLGELRTSAFSEALSGSRTVKDELRANLICKLQRGEALFPGIVGYEDSVVPQLVNAILSKHNFILLGLRGQAKTRLIRLLTTLLDPLVPYIAGSEIHDNPYHPISAHARQVIAEFGDETPIAWLTPEARYIEKLATPDVTIADMIGDIDPIKAARRGADISDELTIHYGLVPRANRGIFAINELPDLAGKIQVGLFNIMQEGDVQIKGYPVRLPLDLLLVFTANPGRLYSARQDHHAAEGSDWQRDSHALPDTSSTQGLEPSPKQEAWMDRVRESYGNARSEIHQRKSLSSSPSVAREDKRVDKRSGVSQRLPISVLENARFQCRASCVGQS